MRIQASEGKSIVNSRGQGVVIVFLVLCVLIAAGLAYLSSQNKEEAVEVAEEAVEPVVVKEPEVEPEIEPEPVVVVEQDVEPEPEPEMEPEIAPEPKPVVVEEKSEVDLYLEKKFPLPSFAPLSKIVNHWESVPTRAFPETVTVRVPHTYEGEGVSHDEEGEHQAKPLEYSKEEMLVASLDDASLVARVRVSDTDFKERVADLYQKKIKQREDKVIAQREAYRARAEKEVAKLQEKAERAARARQASASDFDPKKYGRKFRGDFWPVTKNNKNAEYEHEIPLGPICGTGAVTFTGREFKIVNLWKKGPGAKAGLEQGDVVKKVNGKRFAEYSKSSAGGGEGVPEDLGEAILESQANNQPLVLTLDRAGEEREVSIDLPSMPAFAKKFPADCVRSKGLRDAAVEYLVEAQKESGAWGVNDYSGAWCGLALLSAGDKKYAREIKKAARFYAEKYDLGANPSRKELVNADEGKGDGSNWKVSMVGMFLAEYYLATGDKKVLRALDHCCRSIEARLSPENGRLGHGKADLPYGGKGLVVVNTHAHIMWALSAHIHGFDEWNWEPWELSYKSIEAATGSNGGVGYNFSLRGDSQSANRTGATLTALVLAERDKAKVRGMSEWLIENPNQYLNVHAMTFIGPIYSFMGLKNSSPKQYRKKLDHYQWLFALIQPANYKQGSYYYGSRGNSGGDEYCNKRFCGNIMSALVLSSHRDDTLWMFGNRKRNWLK